MTKPPSGPLRRVFRGLAPAIGCLIAALAAPMILSNFYLSVLTDILAFGVLALSIGYLLSELGMISFGHAGFFALGAYTMGWTLERTDLGLGPSIAIALLFCFVAAAIVGLFVVRVSGLIYFALLTLAFAQIFNILVVQLWTITGGDNGLLFRSMPAAINTTRGHYVFAVAVAVFAVLVIWFARRSTFGAMLNAARDDPIRARALGIDVHRCKIIAFTISGTVAGAGGMAMAVSMGGAFPSLGNWVTSGEGLVIAVLGGIGSLAGAFIGAAILILLKLYALRAVDNWPLVFGIVLLVVVMVTPQGVMGLLSDGMDRLRRGRSNSQHDRSVTGDE